MYHAQTIDDITRATPGRVTTTGNFGWSDKNIVLFRNIGGMTEIEGKKLLSQKKKKKKKKKYQMIHLNFMKILLLKHLDTSAFTGYTRGGQVGLRFQIEEDLLLDDGIVHGQCNTTKNYNNTKSCCINMVTIRSQSLLSQ